MNYRKIYFQLIERAKTRSDLSGYTEIHHVIPKSLGGTDLKSNLVKLTAREHFIAHWLLTKVYDSNKMIFAFWKMCNGNNTNRYVSSHGYQSAKLKFSNAMKERKLSDLHKNKISDSLSGRKLSITHIQAIKHSKSFVSLETRKKMSESGKIKIFTKSHRKNLSLAKIGHAVSKETKLKMSKGQKISQRKYPHWNYYDELFDIWKWLNCPGRKAFRKEVYNIGYPDVDYASMIRNFKDEK